MCSIKNNIIIASILLVIICKLNDASNGGGRGGRRAGRGGRGRTQENSVDVSLVTLNLQIRILRNSNKNRPEDLTRFKINSIFNFLDFFDFCTYF